MASESFFGGRVELHKGDCLDVLRSLPDACIDSCVTDPPYALVSITKRFGKEGAAPAKGDVYARASSGFMGKTWDTGERAFAVEFWAEVLRVLKPGGHVLAFSGTRTYHRLAVAIEDAGFEIRDQVGWLYGSGFPKSHDVSKGIDKAAGHKRGTSPDLRNGPNTNPLSKGDKFSGYPNTGLADLDAGPVLDAARQWQGWGTALKPAWEPIVVARKALIGTVAQNVQEHGTGALNIDGCRVGYVSETDKRAETRGVHSAAQPYDGLSEGGGAFGGLPAGRTITAAHALGRWPANVIHDGSDEVEQAFAAFGSRKSGEERGERGTGGIWSESSGKPCGPQYGDNGTAARFFYTAKADVEDRAGSRRPTVKPVDLMRYLVRLVTRKGGTVLDPFAGTGTTGQAAYLESCDAILIEREAEYQADIARRMALVLAGPDEKAREITKARGKVDHDAGPLFSGFREAAE